MYVRPHGSCYPAEDLRGYEASKKSKNDDHNQKLDQRKASECQRYRSVTLTVRDNATPTQTGTRTCAVGNGTKGSAHRCRNEEKVLLRGVQCSVLLCAD